MPALDRKEVIHGLRAMIREMETQGLSKTGAEGILPGAGRILHGAGAGEWQDIRPATIERTEDGPLLTVRTTYAEGSVPELRAIPRRVLEGLRSCEPGLAGLDRWLFLDIETTGLAGAATVAFLVGFGEWVNGFFQVTQLFLKDRAGEELLLGEVLRYLADRPVTVTFNGKAFDLPILQGRFAVNGMRSPAFPPVHLDLLSLVRNMGKRPEYGQSLTEAVRRFTGATRRDDIPGHLIPALYFIYEREEDISILEPVMKHNRMDILDMVCLLWVFGHVLSGETGSGDAASLGGAGRLHFRKGNLELARLCLEIALGGLPGEGRAGGAAAKKAAGGPASLRVFGHVLRKQGDWKAAGGVWEEILRTGEARDEDYLWLARCYEMASGDIGKSLEVVERAISLHKEWAGETPPSLMSRKRRLLRLMARKTRVIPTGLPS